MIALYYLTSSKASTKARYCAALFHSYRKFKGPLKKETSKDIDGDGLEGHFSPGDPRDNQQVKVLKRNAELR